MGGDADFDAFVRARYDRLARVAFALCGDRQYAEDLLQIALAKTYEHWRKGRVDNLDGYVRRVLVTTQATWWRRRWRGEVPTDPLPDLAGDDLAEDLDRRQAIHHALGRLSAGQRVVLVLRYLEDLSEEETAAVLGCSLGTVKSRASRGLAALRAAGLVDVGTPTGRAL